MERSRRSILAGVLALPVGRASGEGVDRKPSNLAHATPSQLLEFVSVRDFGAVGDGRTDDTRSIQAALDHCESAKNTPSLVIPPGTYKITDSLWFGCRKDPSRRTTLYVQGAGMRSYPVERNDRANVSAGTLIDASSLRDRPAVVIQGVVGGRFSDFSVLGGGFQRNYDLGLSSISSDFAEWVPNGHSSGRYDPSCGIGIDPYSGNTPNGGGYSRRTGVPYGFVQSSGLRFDNVASFGFVIGFGLSVNDQGWLGDGIRFYNCRSVGNAVGYAVCGSQNRDVQYCDCVANSVHTAFDTLTFGARAGDFGHVRGGLVGGAYRVFNIHVGYNASSVSDLYSETIRRIGNVGRGRPAATPGLQMRNCYFKEETESPWNRKDPFFFPQGAFSADGCVFLPKVPWAGLYEARDRGASGATARFVACSFVAFAQKGLPRQLPIYRWYVGEGRPLKVGRPILDACKFGMVAGDTQRAGSWLDADDCSGEPVRHGEAGPPSRKEVINYSASRLVDVNGVGYALKNVSTFEPTQYPVANPMWQGDELSFNVARGGDMFEGDILLHGDSGLPLRVLEVSGDRIRSVTLFDPAFYDQRAGRPGGLALRVSVVDRQFIGAGTTTCDVRAGSRQLVNVSDASVFRVGDFIGADLTGNAFPANTRVVRVDASILLLNKEATISRLRVVVGNLLCVKEAVV